MNSVAGFLCFGWLFVTASAGEQWTDCGDGSWIDCRMFTPEKATETLVVFSSLESNKVDPKGELFSKLLEQVGNMRIVVLTTLLAVKKGETAGSVFRKLIENTKVPGPEKNPITLTESLKKGEYNAIMELKCTEIVTPQDEMELFGKSTRGMASIHLPQNFKDNFFAVRYLPDDKKARCKWEEGKMILTEAPPSGASGVDWNMLGLGADTMHGCSEGISFIYASVQPMVMGYTQIVGLTTKFLLNMEGRKPCHSAPTRRLGASDEIVDPRGVDSDDKEDVMRPKSLGGATKDDKGEAFLI